MSVKKAPVVHLFSWRLVVPLAMLAILIAAGSALGGFSAGVYGGLGAFFLWAIGSQRRLRRRFYRGIRLYRRMEYAEAIPHFQRDLDYWNRFPKVDDWRIVALLSPTPYPYRSSDPRCIGVRHMKCGRIEEAKTHYRLALEAFPGNDMAAWSLKNLEIVEKARQAGNPPSTRMPTG